MDQRPTEYPKASDLVTALIEDVQVVLGTLAVSDDDMKQIKDRFHTSVRRHRHEQERFGKKWKRGRENLKAGKSRHWAT